MDLIYLFNALLRRKWLIILCTLFAVVVAFFFTLRQEKQYKSAAQMATGFTTTDQVKLKDENFDAFEIDVKFNNVVEAMTSNRVLSMVSYFAMIHDLENPAKAFHHPNPNDKNYAAYQRADKSKALEVLKKKYADEQLLSSYDPEDRKILELIKLFQYDLETLRKKLTVSRVARTDFIDIQYLSDNPELSAAIVNQLFSEFMRSNETSRAQQTVESIATLEKLVKQKRDALDDKLNNLRAQGTVDVSVESSSAMEQISNFENRLADEKSTLTSATLALQQITDQLAEMDRTNAKTALTSNANAADLANLKKQVDAAKADDDAKNGSDPDLHKKYMSLKADYNAKRAASLSSSSAGTGTVTKAELLQKKSDLQVQVQSATQNIASYEQRLKQLNSGVNAIAARGATNIALKKELDLAQQEYENVKSRYDAAMNSQVVPLDNFRQILFGQPAVEPEPSKRLIILGLAGISMFVFCCVLIILLEYLDVAIKTPTQFLKTVNLKLLGIINRISLKKTPLTSIFTTELPRKEKETLVLFREHLRMLRYELESRPEHIYLFTSARVGEGKTTVMNSLAHSLAMSKHKVLLVDTNFTNNSLTRQYEAKTGLETYDSEKYDLENIRENLIRETDNEYIQVIGCQGGDYTPSEILPQHNILRQLPSLLAVYDYIFLEGPALNERADSKELMQYVETIISVVSAKSSVKPTDKDSIGFLHNLNGKYAGAILNYVEKSNIDI
ncbi:MAG TPA: Wzz/FepE/Etk N-terminal domain-containing protein [Chitinophaga sp.]